MSENTVEIPFEDEAADRANLLLAAAEDLDLDQSVVRTVEGAFVVPQEVADKAGFGEEKPPPAKKAAKKSNK